MDVGYARITAVNNDDPDNPVISFRYVDILIDNECDEIVEPYFFLYDYGQKERSLHYNLPLEGLNHEEVNSNTLNILGTQVPHVNRVLKYTNAMYFPQIHPSQFSYSDEFVIDPILPTAPLVSTMASGSEDNSEGDSMGHIYIMLRKNETSLQLFYRHNTFNDPHQELTPLDRVPILPNEIILDKEDIELRSIVITLSVDREDLNYSMAIFNDEVETPVKWVVSHPKKLMRALPSINKIREFESNKVKIEYQNLITNGSILGKLNNKFDFESDPIPDISIQISGTSVIINGKSLSNDKPF